MVIIIIITIINHKNKRGTNTTANIFQRTAMTLVGAIFSAFYLQNNGDDVLS